MSKVQTLKSMVAMVVRPLPFIFAAALVMLVAVMLLQLAGVERLLRRLKLRSSPVPAASWLCSPPPLSACFCTSAAT